MAESTQAQATENKPTTTTKNAMATEKKVTTKDAFNLVAKNISTDQWRQFGRELGFSGTDLDRMQKKALLQDYGDEELCRIMLDSWKSKLEPGIDWLEELKDALKKIPRNDIVKELSNLRKEPTVHDEPDIVTEPVVKKQDNKLQRREDLNYPKKIVPQRTDETDAKKRITEPRIRKQNDEQLATENASDEAITESHCMIESSDQPVQKRGRLTLKFWLVLIVGGIILTSALICIIYFWITEKYGGEFVGCLVVWAPFFVGYFTFLIRYYNDDTRPFRTVLLEVLGDMGCYKKKKEDDENDK